jgi:site-specific recombinase XerD
VKTKSQVTEVVASGSLDRLIPSWERSLRAANRSPKTQRAYGDSARLFAEFLRDRGLPSEVEKLGREHVELFIEDQLSRHRASTASVRYRCLQQLFKWLLDEGEITASPMAHMRPPAIPEAPVPVVSDEDLRRLLKACEGTGFEDKRDTAIVRVLMDCGVRLAELTGLRLEDVDFDSDVIVVIGKGRRQRAVPFGSKTSTAIDRYLRVRSRHPQSAANALWLGLAGPLGDSGVQQLLRRRCSQAGIADLHPHQFRHTAAHAWLSAGGTEGDAMRLFGWKSREMLSRYGASAADQRARESYRRLAPGDRL